MAGRNGAVFVCGIARNQDGLLDLFDRVFLLREAGRQEIRGSRAVFEAHMLTAGAIALDGTAPTVAIADQLLALIAS